VNRRARLSSVGAALGILLATASAYADAAGEAAARALFAEGNRKVQEGSYAEALVLFRGAYDKVPNPKILLNIGTTLAELHRDAEAANAYQTYLGDPGADEQKKLLVTKALADLDVRLGRIDVTPDDPAAALLVDQTPVPLRAGAARVRVEPGTHEVVAVLAGSRRAPVTVTARAGEVVRVDLHVERGAPVLPEEPAPGGGSPVRTAGFVVAGVGVVGLGVFAGTAIVIAGKHATFVSHCPQGQPCDAVGAAAAQAGGSLLPVNTATLIIGVAGAAAGGLMIALGGPRRPVTVQAALAPDGGRLGVVGKF
jgi:hypothetical protein